MQKYYFRNNNEFINPRLFRELPYQAQVTVKGNSFESGGLSFRFLEDAPDGDYNAFFNMGYAVESKTYNAFLENKKQEAEKKLNEKIEKSIEERKNAEAYYLGLDFPVKFHVNIKEVLSGLSFNSAGNGHKRNSVVHLVLGEDLEAGRLKRQKGQFLCGQTKSRYGGNWSGDLENNLQCSDMEGKAYSPKITCKECLRKIEILSKKA